MSKVRYATEEDLDAVLTKEGLYVALPIDSAVDAAELVNRVLDHLQGEQEA